jgi:uncharacterized protein (DUF1919 family)
MRKIFNNLSNCCWITVSKINTENLYLRMTNTQMSTFTSLEHKELHLTFRSGVCFFYKQQKRFSAAKFYRKTIFTWKKIIWSRSFLTRNVDTFWRKIIDFACTKITWFLCRAYICFWVCRENPPKNAKWSIPWK